MRVLHVDAGAEMRGGQWQCLHLVAGLESESTLLAPGESPLARCAAERGIEAQPLTLTRLARLARSSDLVHAHDARSHTWAVAVAGAPVVVSRRVAFPIRQSPVSRWKYSRPAHYIAVSKCVRSLLVQGGVPEPRVSVVYDGVVVPDKPARAERIVALASSDPLKGGELIKAAAAGRFEVHFSPDLPQDLQRASIFLYITESEGLGSAALLAMAYGVPVVASRVGGLPEIIEDRRSGVLTDNSPESIQRAVAWALAHREELSHAARAAVERSFTVEKMVEDTRAVYRKVLAC